MPTSPVEDDDGAPPALPPGGRVHSVDANGDIASSSRSPSQEIVDAIRSGRVNEIEPPLVMDPGTVAYIGKPLPSQTERPEWTGDAVSALIQKFPAYNPEWPAKTQAAWFEGFSTLMGIIKGSGQ